MSEVFLPVSPEQFSEVRLPRAPGLLVLHQFRAEPDISGFTSSGCLFVL